MQGSVLNFSDGALQFHLGRGGEGLGNTSAEFANTGSMVSGLRDEAKIIQKLTEDFRPQDLYWRQFFPVLGGMPSRLVKVPSFEDDMKVDHRNIMSRVDGTSPKVITFDANYSARELLDIWLATVMKPIEGEEAADVVKSRLLNKQALSSKLNGIMEMSYEMDAAELVTNWESYETSGNRKESTGEAGAYYWSDTTNGTPVLDLQAARAAISPKGKLANTLACPLAVLQALSRHPDFIGNIGKPLNDVEIRAALKGYGFTNIIITDSVVLNIKTGVYTPAWGSNFCWIGYIERKVPNKYNDSFGYALGRKGYPKSWSAKESISQNEFLVTARCQGLFVTHRSIGYLFKTPLAS